MANRHCLLLLLTTLASSSFDVTRKDHGDYFIWYGNNTITCEEFSRHTASYESASSRCKYNFPLTFSTQSSTCESFTDRGTQQLLFTLLQYCMAVIISELLRGEIYSRIPLRMLRHVINSRVSYLKYR